MTTDERIKRATQLARESIADRDLPFILRAFGCIESRTVRIQVRHTRRDGSALIVDDFTFPITDFFDMVTMPGLNDAITSAAVQANSVEHMARRVV